MAAIVAMANALGVSTTAEGVETPHQAERLGILRVDAAQGYVFASADGSRDGPRSRRSPAPASAGAAPALIESI